MTNCPTEGMDNISAAWLLKCYRTMSMQYRYATSQLPCEPKVYHKAHSHRCNWTEITSSEHIKKYEWPVWFSSVQAMRRGFRWDISVTKKLWRLNVVDETATLFHHCTVIDTDHCGWWSQISVLCSALGPTCRKHAISWPRSPVEWGSQHLWQSMCHNEKSRKIS